MKDLRGKKKSRIINYACKMPLDHQKKVFLRHYEGDFAFFYCLSAI
jgi:hypothetical protein